MHPRDACNIATVATNTRPSLTRWSGLSLLAGGILLAIHYATHPPGENGAEFVLSPLWIPSHIIQMPAMLLILFGLIGWYARQMHRSGSLALVAFVFAVVACVFGVVTPTWAVIVQWELTTVAPSLAALDGPLLASPFARSVLAITAISLAIGFILVAVVTIRDRTLPRPAGWLIIAGLVIAPAFVVSQAVAQIGGVITSLGLTWLGHALWSRPRPTVDPVIAPA